jgi:hypothetical protein
MIHASNRALLGFVAGSLAVLTFHQAVVELLHLARLVPQAAYRVTPVMPFNVPLVVDLSFWGGLYGLLYGLVQPRLRGPAWLGGLALGLLAAAVGMLVVAPLKGHPVAWGWHAWPMLRSCLINGGWGLGVSLLYALLQPRPLVRDGLAAAARTGIAST